MDANEFSFGPGKVEQWDLAAIDGASPVAPDATDELKEDLAQISFPNGLVVDVGWYPEFSALGRFVVVVVHKSDWVNPLLKRECSSGNALKEAIRDATAFARLGSP